MDIAMLGLVLGTLIAATATDLWFREVPDFLTYGLAVLAALFRIIDAVSSASVWPIIEGFLGGFAFWVVGYTLYRLGQWGGGDTKLCVGLGIALGISVNIVQGIIGFVVLLIFASGIYGCFALAVLGVIHRNKIKEFYQHKEHAKYRKYLSILDAVCLVLVILVIVFFRSTPAFYPFLIFILLAVCGIHMSLLARAVEKTVFLQWRKPSELTEGDWIAKDVTLDGKVITGPSDLGVSLESMKILKEAEKKGKITKVLVKEGIPFLPAFLLAFILHALLQYTGKLLLYWL